jgi:peptidoglycan-N-acetylglucosamine deacetylase
MRTVILWTTGLCLPQALFLSWRFSPWCLLIAAPPMALWIWATVVRRCGWWGPVMNRFPTRKREALLTFDNAPHSTETPLVLDLLDEARATGLFFVSAARALQHPELVRDIVRRGHALGVQSARNPWRCWHLPQRVLADVLNTLRVFDTLVPDAPVQWFRSHDARQNPADQPALTTHELQCIGYTTSDGGLGRGNFDRIVIQIRREAGQGTIIALTHGKLDRLGEPLCPDLVRELLLWLKGQGYAIG